MPALCKLHCFLPPFLSRKLFFATPQQQSQLQCDGLTWSIHDRHHLPSRERSLVSVCAIRNSRKKVKSNEELCNDIREFLSAVGLPDDHVPSTKELTDNGRSDLANVVRRRGYKRIRELLVNVPSVDVDGSSEDQSINMEGSSIDELARLGTDENANDMTGDSRNNGKDQNMSSPLESSVNGYSVKHGFNNEEVKRTSQDCATSSSLCKSEQHDEDVEIVKDEEVLGINLVGWSSREALFKEEDQKGRNRHPGFRSSDNTQVPMESDESKGNPSWTPVDLMADESLEEKVAKFVHTGDLDAVEDAVFSPSTAISLNGKTPTSTSVTPPLIVNQALRNDDSSTKSQTLSDLEKDFIVETDRREKETEINNLELMMQQKELELIRLQELVEKETLTLSDLQRKTETEIKKAQNLLVEKDAELVAAEESLTGLVQVTIQYHGDGQSVEVSGSFNGWHHKIAMDPEPSSDENITESSKIRTDPEPCSSDENIAESSTIMTDPEPSSSDQNIAESRKSNIWSITLWLYPGVYEIKFVVDGEWRTDDKMESVAKCGIRNNILRVARDD